MSKRLFVTGRLAAGSLKDTIKAMALDVPYDIAVLPISVASLMNTQFLQKHLSTCSQYSQVILPGLCRADTTKLTQFKQTSVVKGPKDLKDLPAFYGEEAMDNRATDIVEPRTPQIVAEIVDAPYLNTAEIISQAIYYQESGADFIDLGSCMEKDFPHLEEAVKELKRAGMKVSLDSFKEAEIMRALESGIDLILSLNKSNLHLASRLTCPVVILPDFDASTLESLEHNLAEAQAAGADCILDPILSPLNFGLSASLERFAQARRRFPQLPFLMGIGNVTELTDADSTGINALLMGVAHELGIDYVLTTEASSRTRGAVKEAALARKLIHQAKKKGTPPKNISLDLITVKDQRLESFSPRELRQMHLLVTDTNFRIFIAADRIFIFNRDLFLSGTDPDKLFLQLNVTDPQHANYLGQELYKARLALRLGKKYVQDRELNWGYLSSNWAL
jgi:dihydropteroate synthase-like protein